MNGSGRPQPVSWIARLLRGVWPDGNPLRRTTDRAHAAVIAGLVAAFVTGAPVAALTAGHLAGAAALTDEHLARYKVHAVLLQASPGTFSTPYGPVAMAALASWKAPDGSVRSGLVKAGASGRAGAIVSIWTDRAGRPTGPPPPPRHVAAQEALAALTAPLVFGLVLLLAGMVAVGMLNRRRLTAWDTAWSAIEPRWTSRT